MTESTILGNGTVVTGGDAPRVSDERAFSATAIISPLAVAWLLGAAVLQAQIPAGDFQINSYTTGGQSAPQVAVAAGGDFIVVWTSEGSPGSDTSFSSVQGQRYSLDGTPVGGQFQVNSTTPGQQGDASVAMAAGGDFVVVWGSAGSPGSGSPYSIQGQRFTREARPIGSQFQVNSSTTSLQGGPSVAMDAGGDFVVVWETFGYADNRIKARRFTADGQPAGGELLIADTDAQASVAIDADGSFVVVWGGGYYDGDFSGQRYAADGTPVGPRFVVDDSSGYHYGPSVATVGNGDFFVVWDDGYNVRGRRLAADGSPLGGWFQVNSYSTGEQRDPSVAATADGAFVVVWRSDDRSGSAYASQTARGQRFAADGRPVGSEVRLNSYIPLFLWSPSVALADGGEILAVWQNEGSSGSDTSSSSVWGRRLQLGCVPTAEVLCLAESRFELTVEWRDFQGRSGTGTAVTLSRDSGSYWFFDPANVEVVVKVLDGVTLNGHFWVFYGALSNVEYTLRVTDTETGHSKTYFNPLGHLGSVGDTQALPGS